MGLGGGDGEEKKSRRERWIGPGLAGPYRRQRTSLDFYFKGDEKSLEGVKQRNERIQFTF